MFQPQNSKNRKQTFLPPTPYSLLPSFTILEILITVTIVALLSSAAAINYLSAYRRGLLETQAQGIVSVLRRAQQKALGQEEGLAWGVHFDNVDASRAFTALFAGSTYNPSAVRETVYLAQGLEFAQPTPGGGIDVVFSKFTGKPAASASIIIQIKSNSAQRRVISVNEAGTVSISE